MLLTRRSFGRFLAGSALAGRAGLAAAATDNPALGDALHAGPAVSDKPPAFELPDQTGAVRSLSSLMGPRGLVLVFLRSADW